MMAIHREGTNILLITLALLVLFNLGIIKGLHMARWSSITWVIASVIFYIWMLLFFRNPTRTIIPQAAAILSPADGKIVAIERVYESEYMQTDCIQVSIFMSPFNVHVNRSPIGGDIQYFKYHPGKYLVAFHPKSSTKNERTTVVVKRQDGLQILFRQIAGFVARRIVFYPKEGDTLNQGDEVGFIKFGSRLDVFLPLDAQIEVSLGEKVKGGLTVLAKS
jgi:phosphatidylserine decarboxylase